MRQKSDDTEKPAEKVIKKFRRASQQFTRTSDS
jgi:hypothetical protein